MFFNVLATALCSTALLIAGCGGGGATDPFFVAPTPPTPALIASPASLNIYAGTPSVVTINSGVGPFQVFTSDAIVLPVTQLVSGAAITLTASNVAADAAVTLTIRDAAGQSTTVAVSVKTSPLLGALTVTPTSNSTCAGTTASLLNKAAICSGESGVASITVRGANSTVLPNRQIRFDVVQGPYNFLIDQAGLIPAKSVTLTTDQNGKADVVIRTVSGTESQAALIRATDLTSGNRVDSAFTVVQAINGSAILSVVPNTYTGAGGFVKECLSFAGDYVIYGGTAPYRVTNGLPNAGTIASGNSIGQVIIVAAQGGIFRFTSFYVADNCGGFKAPLTIADATGRITTVDFNIVAGTTPRPVAPVVPVAFSPSAVSFTANIGGSPGEAAIPAIAPSCSDGSAPQGQNCQPVIYTPFSCTDGVLNATKDGCLVPRYVPVSCTTGVLNVALNGCVSATVGGPTPPAGSFVPASCVNGTINSGGSGCVAPTYVAAKCSNGLFTSASRESCVPAFYNAGFAGRAAIAAVPNSQCSARDVVYTINGGFTPYSLSSSLPGVTPSPATISTAPSNVTVSFPVLNIGVVTLTAVDAKGSLFTATATCSAS